MNKKIFPYLILVVLAILVIVVKKYKQNNRPVSKPKTETKRAETSPDRNKGFDRRVSFLEYSNHAKCRMECRQISQTEVEEIMQDGRVNYNKSDLHNTRCPRYAVEGITDDDQRVRIVFAQCNEKTAVVTVIDLNTDWTCHCPGDDKKFENRN